LPLLFLKKKLVEIRLKATTKNQPAFFAQKINSNSEKRFAFNRAARRFQR